MGCVKFEKSTYVLIGYIFIVAELSVDDITYEELHIFPFAVELMHLAKLN